MTAVRPPEFFPTPEVSALLLAADRVVLADTLLFSRQSAHNRARIRDARGPHWLSVPREHTGTPTPLAALPIARDTWAKKHMHALRTGYGMAPYVEHVLPEIEALLLANWPSLGALTVATTRWTARWLGATAEIVVASESPGAPDTLDTIWQASGGDTLLALPSSASRDRQKLGVSTQVLTCNLQPYRQAFDGFVPGCSSLDLILNHGPAAADLLRSATRIAPFKDEASGARG